MSTPINDGGPAFPCPATGLQKGDASMSLRAYMATQFAAAMISNLTEGSPPLWFKGMSDGIPSHNQMFVVHEEYFAASACKLADALIAELAKGAR